jgi:uncharacterized alpha/beta hydrolase family protein
MRSARSLPFGAVVVVAVAALVAAPAGAKKKDGKLDPDKVTPLIFVHGGSGSGGSSSPSRCG